MLSNLNASFRKDNDFLSLVVNLITEAKLRTRQMGMSFSMFQPTKSASSCKNYRNYIYKLYTDYLTWQHIVYRFVLQSSLMSAEPKQDILDIFDENDEEVKRLLEEKHRLQKAHHSDTNSVSKKAAYSNIYKTVKNRLRDVQDKNPG